MTAGGLPIVQVFLDDGSNTFPYELKDAAGISYARMAEGITGSRGRLDELANVTAGQWTCVFDNTDGRFSYGSTLIGSPSPILVDQLARLKLTANGTTVNRYTGTLSADPVAFPSGGDEFAIASATFIDAQAQAERRTLRSVPEEELLVNKPTFYFPFSEPAGATAAADTSGSQFPQLKSSGGTVTFGSTAGMPTTGSTTADFAGGNSLVATTSYTYGNIGTYDVYFLTIKTSTVGGKILGGQNSGSGLSDVLMLDGSGQIRLNVNGSLAIIGPVVTDGQWHTVRLINDWTAGAPGSMTLIVDGVNQGTYATGGSGTMTLQVGNGLVGSIGQLSLTRTVAAITDTLSTAYSTGFAGESGTARLTRLAGYAGIPIGTLDASLTNVPFVDVTGKTAWAAMQEVAEAEFGLIFIDGSGNLTFHNRNRAVAKSAPDITIDANFLDPGTQFYYDNQGILNYVDVTAVGTSVTQVVRNTVSELGAAGSPKHGRYTDSKKYVVPSDAEALDRGNWLVGTHGQPLPRVGSLVVDLLTQTAAQQAAWLAVEANTWVRITGLPAQSGNPGGTTADLIVEGFGPETLKGDTWALTLNAVQRTPFFQGWILGDTTYSVLGSTTILYV